MNDKRTEKDEKDINDENDINNREKDKNVYRVGITPNMSF